ISMELWDACYLMLDFPEGDVVRNFAEWDVLTWLRYHQKHFIEAEARWNVDRRGIAGAIAWEALEHTAAPWNWRRLTMPLISPGPGKIRLHNWNPFLDTFRKDPILIQAERAGYAPFGPLTDVERSSRVHWGDGAIHCIAAIMRAVADAAHLLGGFTEEET